MSPNRIYELVWDSESEEAEKSKECIIYLGDRILCIFDIHGDISVLVTNFLIE